MIFQFFCDFQISEIFNLNDFDLSEKDRSERIKNIVKSRFTKAHDFTYVRSHEIRKGRNNRRK